MALNSLIPSILLVTRYNVDHVHIHGIFKLYYLTKTKSTLCHVLVHVCFVFLFLDIFIVTLLHGLGLFWNIGIWFCPSSINVSAFFSLKYRWINFFQIQKIALMELEATQIANSAFPNDFKLGTGCRRQILHYPWISNNWTCHCLYVKDIIARVGLYVHAVNR